MSEHDEAVDASEGKSSCASCGIAEVDDIKLVPCDNCDLVRYCSDDCKEDHRSEHDEACKKRAAELRDELLFKQPESSHFGECPICSLPLPLDNRKSGMTACCSKVVCFGCRYANNKQEEEMGHRQSCPFCRKHLPRTNEEHERLRMKRVAANDPVALCREGGKEYDEGDFNRAFEYWTKAAELGDADAHFKLSLLYHDGLGVEKDEEKEIRHLEEAAIGGHPAARYNRGCHEYRFGNVQRAVKHWIIAATLGDDLSIKALMEKFREGEVGKDVLAGALRAHKAAVDAMKSSQRREAEDFYQSIGVL